VARRVGAALTQGGGGVAGGEGDEASLGEAEVAGEGPVAVLPLHAAKVAAASATAKRFGLNLSRNPRAYGGEWSAGGWSPAYWT
jgi:hypothetical protein